MFGGELVQKYIGEATRVARELFVRASMGPAEVIQRCSGRCWTVKPAVWVRVDEEHVIMATYRIRVFKPSLGLYMAWSLFQEILDSALLRPTRVSWRITELRIAVTRLRAFDGSDGRGQHY